MKNSIAILASLLVIGCGDSNNTNSNNATNNTPTNASIVAPPIDPGDYDQSCQFDSDCMLVRSGDVCGCEPCSDAAINVSDGSKYQSDLDAGSCESTSCSPTDCDLEQVPFCSVELGTCELREAQYVSVSAFDISCAVDADCIAVFEGEVCAECQECSNAAVNVAAAEFYAESFDLECAGGGADCSCTAVVARCDAGSCTL